MIKKFESKSLRTTGDGGETITKIIVSIGGFEWITEEDNY